MENRTDYPHGLPMDEIMKLANSPKGQAILAQLQNQHPQELETAISQAQAGNMEQVNRTVNDFLNSPAGKELIKQLRG